jgi:hypothetical protein
VSIFGISEDYFCLFQQSSHGYKLSRELSISFSHRGSDVELPLFEPSLLVQKRRQLFSRTPFSRSQLQDQTHRELVYRRLQFQKRSQLFIRANNETLPVAMRVHNPDCSPARIDG